MCEMNIVAIYLIIGGLILLAIEFLVIWKWARVEASKASILSTLTWLKLIKTCLLKDIMLSMQKN